MFARIASGITDHKRLIIGLTPGVGLAQDYLELVTGFDIDNNRLDGIDRGFAALGVLTGGLGSKLRIPAKAAVEMLQARKALPGGAVPQAVDAAVKALETKKIFVEGNNVKRAFKVEKIHSTDALNSESISRLGREPPHASGRYAADLRTIGQQEFVRVYSLENRKVAEYLTRPETIAGKTPEQIKNLLNLKDTPKYVVDVTLPENSLLRRSPIGKNRFGEGEGKIQYELLNPPEERFFGKPRLLEVSPTR